MTDQLALSRHYGMACVVCPTCLLARLSIPFACAPKPRPFLGPCLQAPTGTQPMHALSVHPAHPLSEGLGAWAASVYRKELRGIGCICGDLGLWGVYLWRLGGMS